MSYASFEKFLVGKLRNLTVDELMCKSDCDKLYGTHRSRLGFSDRPGELLSVDVEKLHKGSGREIVMLALAPAETSGRNVCPHSTAGCREHCVAHSGNGKYPAITRARVARTNFLAEHPVAFVSLLVHLLDRKVAKGDVAVRLNGFSDIRWERVLPDWFWVRYSDVLFYDYTKHSSLSRPPATMPANYTLTYSVTERTTVAALHRELSVRNVAVVVDVRGGKDKEGKLRPLPTLGLPVVDGDKNDRRFDDPAGSVVMLRRKGTLPSSDPLVVKSERLASFDVNPA